MSGSDPRLAAPFQGAGEPYCSSSVCGELQRNIPMFLERQRGQVTGQAAEQQRGQGRSSTAVPVRRALPGWSTGIKGLSRVLGSVQAREEPGFPGESGWAPWGRINVLLQDQAAPNAACAAKGRRGRHTEPPNPIQQNKSVALGGVWVRTKNAAGCRLRAGATAAGPAG